MSRDNDTAAFNLATWTISSSPPDSVWHTFPGLALHKGQAKVIGLTRTPGTSDSGFFFGICWAAFRFWILFLGGQQAIDFRDQRH